MKRLALVLVLATALAACYGSYGAFQKVRQWNGEVTDNKWANSGIHLAMWIVPVYPIVLFGDFFIFNTVEHFTGENPFGASR